ncbi:MAG: 50S ribosomal protein L18 [Oligoflexales bacterium]|nr:50S ribosomal protein L18 [Oligoflexales bacterium]
MTKKVLQSRAMHEKRKKRVRAKISGTSERPRLCVFRSDRHIYAQVIDDNVGKTLVSISSYSKTNKDRANKDKCVELGKNLAQKCKAANIDKVVFDRNGRVYHGRVKAFAEGAREGGLNF